MLQEWNVSCKFSAMMALWFEREAGTMLIGMVAVTFMACTLIILLMRGKKKRPYGWLHAHLLFSMASVGWAFQALKPRSSFDEPQSIALAAMSFHLWTAVFVWGAAILCLLVGMHLFKETEERE